MSSSRRKFLTAGMLTAVFAAVPLKSVLGRGDFHRGAGFFSFQDDPLANYTKATFTYYLNSVFQLHTGAGVVVVTLMKVDDLAAASGGECFSLLFRGGSRALAQGTYIVEHPSLGSFPLFLVPSGADNNGAQGYLATINRLSYSDAAAPAPGGSTKRGWIIQMEDTSAPAKTSPATTAPAPPTAPVTVTPKANPKPVTKIRKPAWKRTEEDDFDID